MGNILTAESKFNNLDRYGSELENLSRQLISSIVEPNTTSKFEYRMLSHFNNEERKIAVEILKIVLYLRTLQNTTQSKWVVTAIGAILNYQATYLL